MIQFEKDGVTTEVPYQFENKFIQMGWTKVEE